MGLGRIPGLLRRGVSWDAECTSPRFDQNTRAQKRALLPGYEADGARDVIQKQMSTPLTTEHTEHAENFKSVLAYFRVFRVFRG